MLVAFAARDPDRAERFAWRATRRLPPRWHTRFTRARRTSWTGSGRSAAGRGSWPSSARRRRCGSPTWPCTTWSASTPSRSTFRSAYFLLEGIGNLALAVPATAAGIGTFDYLTLLAAKGIDVPVDKASAYVLTMHALAVLPVTIMGAILVSPAFPRLGPQTRGARAGARLAGLVGARVLAREKRKLA